MSILPSSLSIRSRLMIIFILISIIASVILIYIGYNSGKNAIESSIKNQLQLVKESKRTQIEDYFSDLRNVTEILGSNSYIREAFLDFKRGFEAISNNEINQECKALLSDHYVEFTNKLAENIEVRNDIDNYYPNTAAACYLQYEYIIENEAPLGQKNQLVSAKDTTIYDEAHKKHHPYFNQILEQYNFYDIFLIDLEKGDIIYSVFKETDFGTNLFYGPYQESNLAKLANILRINKDSKVARTVDFEFYRPSYGRPAAFIGIPIPLGDLSSGALVIQIPESEINDIMNSEIMWDAHGLGESGEVFLLGDDSRLRSQTRMFINNSAQFISDIQKSGMGTGFVEKMEKMNTTILNLPLRSQAATEALNGNIGFAVVKDFRDNEVLSAYGPVNIEDLNWAILAEVDRSESIRPIMSFQKRFIAAFFIIVLVCTFLAMILSGYFVRPIERLSKSVSELKAGNYSARVVTNSNDEFGQLGQSFNSLAEEIELQQQTIHNQSRENERILFNFLPESIVKKLQKGEENIVGVYPNTTVIIISLSEFDELSQNVPPEEFVRMLNLVLEGMFEISQKHHIEKVRTIGENYVGVCGMFHPRLDSAKKTFEFALEVSDFIKKFGQKHKMELHMKFAIHSGEINAGILGTESYSFDLWGKTITEIESFENDIDDGKIVVTTPVYSKIKEFYQFETVKLENNDLELWQYQGSKA